MLTKKPCEMLCFACVQKNVHKKCPFVMCNFYSQNSTVNTDGCRVVHTFFFVRSQVVAGNMNSPTSLSSQHDQEIVSRLTESTEKLLKNVLFETEAIKLNTEQISKDLKSALEKCKVGQSVLFV